MTTGFETGLDQALDEARRRYIERNPQSQARHRQAVNFLPGGNTRTVLYTDPFPIGIERGEGCRLWDLDGHEYIDFLGEYTAGLYGHSHPVILAAVRTALEGGINLSGHTRMEARLAHAVCRRFPSIELVRFTNSGTEANLMAVAAARAITGRNKIMVFEGGYHGGVFTFAGGGSPINAPYDFVVAPYNDPEGTAALLRQHGPELAAILVEPLMGSAGCIAGDPAFLQLLREEATRQGAVLIFDEVMTSRLGPGGLQAELGILPDMTTLGKYIGGGMSFGAFGGRRELMERFDPGRPGAFPHAGTFNNNILTMSAGYAGLTQVYTPEVAVEFNRRGDRLRESLNSICRRYQAPVQFTGRGTMLNLHTTSQPVTRPADTAAGDPRLKELFFLDMLEAGIWLAKRGFMALCLPLGEAEFVRLEQALADFLEQRRPLYRPAGRLAGA